MMLNSKKFLSEKELQILNLLLSQFLDFAELQALEENHIMMKNLDNHLSEIYEFNPRYNLLKELKGLL